MGIVIIDCAGPQLRCVDMYDFIAAGTISVVFLGYIYYFWTKCKSGFMAGLYVHIPFCKRLCGYCDFFKSVSLKYVPETVVAIEREMEYQKEFFANDRLQTIYFGGGTPTVCQPSMIRRMIDKADELWGTEFVHELTIEANPDDLTREYLDCLSETSVNRLSIGIQSFVDRDLTFMNRRHDAAKAVECVKDAQKAGFGNITVDLIYGIPGMTSDEWKSNIQTVLSLGVQHVSAYHLSIEQGTMFCRRGVKPICDEDSHVQYMMLHEMLTDAGYEHYEISNFALKGYRSEHNASYWNGVRYLGVGPSAHSYDGRMRWWSKPSLGLYLKNVAGESIYEKELLDEHELFDECVMLGLRQKEGIDKRLLAKKFGAYKLLKLLAASEKFVSSGVLVDEDDRLRFTPEKWLVSDGVISELFDE